MTSYNNQPTNISGKRKEQYVLELLSKRYNSFFYENNVFYDEWGQRHSNQNYSIDGENYICPDIYITDKETGKSIIIRVEVKGFPNIIDNVLPGEKT